VSPTNRPAGANLDGIGHNVPEQVAETTTSLLLTHLAAR
jgi:hypothetical protein